MSHDQVAAAYDQLAERWLDDRFPRDNAISHYRRALAFLKERNGAALNVGCGCNTRFDELLRQNGLRPEGIDIPERIRDADGVCRHLEFDQLPETHPVASARRAT